MQGCYGQSSRNGRRDATPVVRGSKRAGRAAVSRRAKPCSLALRRTGAGFAVFIFRNNGILQVICPTSQMFSRDRIGQRSKSYCAWGCFRYFGSTALVAMRQTCRTGTRAGVGVASFTRFAKWRAWRKPSPHRGGDAGPTPKPSRSGLSRPSTSCLMLLKDGVSDPGRA